MNRDGYISDKLLKMGDQLKLKAEESETEVELPQEEGEKKVLGGRAQERRLSDISRARLDLLARLARSIGQLEEAGRRERELMERRLAMVEDLNGKLAALQSLEEPEGGRELHEYIRSVEHLRLEFFTMESQLEALREDRRMHGGVRSAFTDMAERRSGVLLRFALLWSLPVVLAILIAGVVIGAAVLWAMKI